MANAYVREEALLEILRGLREDILGHVSVMFADREPPIPRHGVVFGGSYNAEYGTIHVTDLDSAAMIEDDGDMVPILTNVPLIKENPNHHYAPVGGERVLLVRTNRGWAAKLYNEKEDALGANAGINPGEHWFTHRNQTGPEGLAYQGAIDVFIKLLNDGASTGDAKGGLAMLAGALLSIVTGGGHTITADDTANKITIQGGNSDLAIVIDVGAGTISVGALAGPLVLPDDGVVRYSDLEAIFTAFAATCQALQTSAPPPPQIQASQTVLASS